MRKLALSDEILMQIDKPARYIGGEKNSVMKDKTDIAVRFVMCFPDLYEIGMSHLGIQILYGMFNSYEDTWCERVYSPGMDLDAIMREKNIPLFALESQDPVKDFDFLGITLQYEMCYTNILQILDLSGIPFTSSERTWEDPIVIGGGPCSYNPEPIAEFFDLFYIGEGETRYRELLDLYKKDRADGVSREGFLHHASLIPGIYVPSLYNVSYNEGGTVSSFDPVYEDVPRTVKKQIVEDLSDSVQDRSSTLLTSTTSQRDLLSATCKYAGGYDFTVGCSFSHKSFAMQNFCGSPENRWCPVCVFHTHKSTR